MSSGSSLEKTFDGAFKNAPSLPAGGKKFLVTWLPWLNLLAGVLALWAAYAVYHWAHFARALTSYANSLSQALGTGNVVSSRWSVGIWIGLIVLIIEGLLFLAAFPGTNARKKSGWNLMFYALVLNGVYGIVSLFTDYGGSGSLIIYLIEAIIGLYLLFQIRDSYTG